VKYIRKKRRTRQFRRPSIPINLNRNDSDDEDFDRAIEASLETFREEMVKRDEITKVNSDEGDYY
jgi:hypothetical protein